MELLYHVTKDDSFLESIGRSRAHLNQILHPAGGYQQLDCFAMTIRKRVPSLGVSKERFYRLKEKN